MLKQILENDMYSLQYWHRHTWSSKKIKIFVEPFYIWTTSKTGYSRYWYISGCFLCWWTMMVPHLLNYSQDITEKQFQWQLRVPSHKQNLLRNIYMKESISHSFSYKKLRSSICCIFEEKHVANKFLCNGQLYQTSSNRFYYEPYNES